MLLDSNCQGIISILTIVMLQYLFKSRCFNIKNHIEVKTTHTRIQTIILVNANIRLYSDAVSTIISIAVVGYVSI